MSDVESVLTHYPGGAAAKLEFLGNRGGFSGARLWRAETPAGLLCVRAWPQVAAEQLATIHFLQDVARGARLAFVPAVLRTHWGASFVEWSGRFWEVTTWMAGAADFHKRPSPARLIAALKALAGLHRAWENHQPRRGPCRAIARRRQAFQAWAQLWQAGWRPSPVDDDPVGSWAKRALVAVSGAIEQVPVLLERWRNVELPLHPCLCDIWHDHVLFTEDDVTGVVDYGSVKWDNVAVDLARLVGSLVGDDAAGRALAITSYRGVRPFSAEEERLVDDLDRSGTILGAANWLRWLFHEGRHYDNRALAAERLSILVKRIEAW